MRRLLALVGAVRRNRKVATTAKVMAMRTLALGVNLCTGLLSAAMLGPEGRGVQAAMITGPQFLAALSTLGLHAALIYNMKHDPENEGRYLGTCLLLGVIAGAVASAIGWQLAPHWLYQYSAYDVRVSQLFMLLAPVSLLSLLLGAALEAHGRFGIANRSLYVGSFTTLAALLLMWWTGTTTPVMAACAYMLPSLLVLAYMAIMVLRDMRPVFTLRRRFVQPSLHYGLRFYGIDVLYHVSTYVDQLVVVLFLPPEDVGIYTVALSLGRILGTFQSAVTSVLFPSIAARDTQDVLQMVGLTVRVMIVVNSFAVIGGIIVGPYVLELLYGPKFAPAISVFRILLVESIVSNAARTLYSVFSGTGRPGSVTLFEIAGICVSLVAMLVLVPRFGIDGAALSLLIASCARLAAVLMGMRHILHVKLPRLIIGLADVRWVTSR